MLTTILSILVALLILSVLIVAHEFGHFIAAKKAGIWVEEFGIGLPPRVFGKKIGETIYSVNLLPFGGFVRLHGEVDKDIKKPSRAYVKKSKKARVAIAIAGILANFLIAIICFSLVYAIGGIPETLSGVKVLEVDAGSPAEMAGIKPDDLIVKVADQDINNSDQFIEFVNAAKGQKTTLEIKRLSPEEKVMQVSLRPREDPPEGEGALGVTIDVNTVVQVNYPPVWQRPFVGLYYGVRETYLISKAVVVGIASIFIDISEGQAPEGVVGPLGITALIAYVVQLGFLPLLNFVGLISVNLALINIIPFPPMDGSRVVFITSEALFGRKVLPKVESVVNTIGIILLILLLITLTFREVPQAFRAGSLNGFIESIIPVQ